MDLLAGYGSDPSDSDSEHEATIARAPSPVAPKRTALFSSLPAPKQLSSAPSVTSSHTVPNNTSTKTSSLPSDFFDPPPATSSTLPPLPSDFFDSAPLRPTPSARPASPPTLGPSKPPSAAPPPTQDDIPKPSTDLWSNLPAPKASGRVVTFTLPVKTALLKSAPKLDDLDDDLPRPAKKPKPSGTASLFDILPAPRHASITSANLQSSSSHPSASTSHPLQDGQHSQNPAEGQPSGYDPSALYSNEMYRADATFDASSSGPQTDPLASSSYDQQQYYQYQDYQQYQQDPAYSNQQADASGQAYYPPSEVQPPGPGATPEEEDIFQQALKAERERAAKRGGGAAAGDIKFVELNQQQLKYVPPSAQDSHNALQNALGSDYAMEVRAKAKAHLGSKLARRKHQIGTLYHNAKLMELEMMEQRAQSMKTKAETAAKYGW